MVPLHGSSCGLPWTARWKLSDRWIRTYQAGEGGPQTWEQLAQSEQWLSWLDSEMACRQGEGGGGGAVCVGERVNEEEVVTGEADPILVSRSLGSLVPARVPELILGP